MEHNQDYKIPLAELLAILKADGYEVSVERILEIQSVLLSTPVSKLSLSELKYIITPVLARNEEDQENIYKIVDSYITEKLRHNERHLTPFTKWLNNRYVIFGLKVALFMFIVTVAFAMYFFQKKESGKKQVLNYPQQLPAPDTARINKKHDTVIAKPTVELPKIAPALQSKVEYNGKPIVPIKMNIILQIAGAFGLGLGGILYYLIFFEKRKRMEAERKMQEDPEAFSASREKGKDASKQLVYASIQFPEKNFLIQKSKEFSTIRANLKKTAPTGKRDLHIKESVYATTKSAGFPSLVFSNPSKERKYLFLVDLKEEDAHINHLFDYLISFLSSSKIPVVKYTYHTDIMSLLNRNRETTSLEDLSYDYPDHEVIIIGDCHSFFDNETLVINNDLDDLFQNWPSKSIITPVPLPDWKYHEEQLQKLSFHIVPAEISAIELLTKSISEESIIKPQILSTRVRNKYSVAKLEFNTAVELSDYLNNEDLFQAICSLAVYPKLNWNLTVALFAAILKRDPNTARAIKLDYDTLLKISRIPWLHTNQLDDSFRLQLLNFLKPDIEVIARETIIALLQEINPFVQRDSPAWDELQVQLRINSFFLYAHDPQQYKHYADVKNDFLDHWKNLDDWALKERAKNGLMPVTDKGQPETVEEFVLQEKQFEKRNVTFLRIVLLILPAAILYIILSVSHPPFVYPGPYEKVSFLAIIKKDASCKEEITRVIVRKLDKFDTTSLKTLNDNSYIEINNTEYDRTVNLSFLFADNSSVQLPVEAKDSVVVVSLRCP